MVNTDIVLKALEDEIERAEHQMAIASTYVYDRKTDMSERKQWKLYLRNLHEKAAEIALLGIQDEE